MDEECVLFFGAEQTCASPAAPLCYSQCLLLCGSVLYERACDCVYVHVLCVFQIVQDSLTSVSDVLEEINENYRVGF